MDSDTLKLGLGRRRSHPGWIMLLIAAGAVFMSAPGQSFSVAAFVDPMLADLKLDRTNYSVAYMVATLIGGFALPLVGRIVDRRGARIVLPIVTLGLGLACGWMSQVKGLIGLYTGFTMIRCLGQGSLTLIGNWIIGEWFRARRGLAAGVCAVGGTLSVFIVPQVNNALIDSFGWRNTWIALGVMVCVALILPAIIFLRDRPEALGLLPDGQFPPEPKPSPSAAQACAAGAIDDDGVSEDDAESSLPGLSSAAEVVHDDERSFTVKQALRFSAFWKISSVIATVSLVGTGLMFHQVSILADSGVSRSMALTALGIQAGAATVSALLAGFLIDHLPARFVLAFSMLFEILALLLLLCLPGPKWVFVYSALLGLHGGIIRSAGSMVWINYFGRQFQGSIQGVSMSIMVLAAALGPLPLAMCKDITGDYTVALWALLILPTCAGIAVLSALPPEAAARRP